MSQVHWLEQCAADVPEQNDWLSIREVLSLNRLLVPKRRADWRLGRWTAKRALAAWCKLAGSNLGMAGIEIRPAASGAPDAFVEDQPAGVTISISHRHGIAVCAVAPSGTELGCDLELAEPRSELFLSDYFTKEEQELVARTPVEDRPRVMALLWSGKESALKALRIGLRVDTRSVVVQVDRTHKPDGGWHPLHVRVTGGATYRGWWQQTADLVRTVVAAPVSPPPIVLELCGRQLA